MARVRIIIRVIIRVRVRVRSRCLCISMALYGVPNKRVTVVRRLEAASNASPAPILLTDLFDASLGLW